MLSHSEETSFLEFPLYQMGVLSGKGFLYYCTRCLLPGFVVGWSKKNLETPDSSKQQFIIAPGEHGIISQPGQWKDIDQAPRQLHKTLRKAWPLIPKDWSSLRGVSQVTSVMIYIDNQLQTTISLV